MNSGCDHEINIGFEECDLLEILSPEMREEISRYSPRFYKYISLRFNKYTGDYICTSPIFETDDEYLADLHC